MRKLISLASLVPVIAALLLAVACTDGDGEPSPEPTGETPSAATPTVEPTPQPTGEVIVPPLEGPERTLAFKENTNYREQPEFQLPAPEDVPEAPADAEGAEFHPPEEPVCPDGWEILRRPVEGFEVCYPATWRIDGHGYVSAGLDDRWYSVGLFLFEDGRQLAHVSIYIINPYAQPFLYTRDCQQAYRATFAAMPAVLCPDLSGRPPEGKIIAYHVRRDDLDYFLNVVPYFEYDEEEGGYLDSWPEEIEEQAIQVAHTFLFTPLLEPGE